jgi:hypothetical protein
MAKIFQQPAKLKSIGAAMAYGVISAMKWLAIGAINENVRRYRKSENG